MDNNYREFIEAAHWTIDKLILDGIDSDADKILALKGQLATYIAKSLTAKHAARILAKGNDELTQTEEA